MKKDSAQIKKQIIRKSRPYKVRLLMRLFRKLPDVSKFNGYLNSIVIFAQEKIGDAILLTPLFKNLKKYFPNIKIDVVAFSPLFGFYENDKNIDHVYRVKQDYFEYFKQIRKQSYDILFCPKDHPSFTFLWHSKIIRADIKVGIYHKNHSGFFNHLIKVDFDKHIVEKNCALLDFLGIGYSKEDCRPYLPEEPTSKECDEFCEKIKNKKFIGINLSAGERQREWSLVKWKQFLQNYKNPVVILCTPDRLKDKIVLEDEFGNVIKSPSTKSIYEVGQIIKNLDVLVSPDTSLVHVASCFNTNVVGLYRAEQIHYQRFYPYLVKSETVISPTENIENIPVDEVIHAIQRIN